MTSARSFPPTPNGWFAVAFSDEIKRGAVRRLRAFDRDLVMFRTVSGEAAVLDAYCPHLGAHLGHGGRVVAETIECPFHRWRFGVGGECRAVPYARKIPPRAGVRSWSCAEANGMVHVYHHADGAPPSSPPAAFEHFDSPHWASLRCWEYQIHSHPQEIAENVSDLMHFAPVHHTATTAPELRVDGERFSVTVDARATLRDMPLPFPARISMTCHGLGHVAVNLRMAPFSNVLILAYATPIEGDLLQVRHRYLAEIGRGPTAPLRWLMGQAMGIEARAQVMEDREIWSRKVYRPIPRLCEEDRLVGSFRKWARQFYGAGEVVGAGEIPGDSRDSCR
jgi:3-ketosteroid 9alpha-monooxygenase subunit A